MLSGKHDQGRILLRDKSHGCDDANTQAELDVSFDMLVVGELLDGGVAEYVSGHGEQLGEV